MPNFLALLAVASRIARGNKSEKEFFIGEILHFHRFLAGFPFLKLFWLGCALRFCQFTVPLSWPCGYSGA